MAEILLTILSSSVKFAMTFPLVIMQFGFSFLETVLWTNVGGLLGIYFFAYISDWLIRWWRHTFRKNKPRKKEKKVFSGKTRRMVRIKQNYGLPGIAFTTPLLLSIPVGTFLAVRYYRTSKWKLPLLIASNLLWSVLYTLFYMFWKDLLFKGA